MKKILLLLIGGLLIACMAGSAMAETVNNDNLIPADSVNVPAGSTTTIYFHADPSDPYFSSGYYTLQLSVSGSGITAEIPQNYPIPSLKTSGSTKTGYINYDGRWWYEWTPTSKLYPLKITRSSSSTGDGVVTVSFIKNGNFCQKSVKITDSVDVTSVPEFPTVALPVAAIMGLVFIFGRKKEGL